MVGSSGRNDDEEAEGTCANCAANTYDATTAANGPCVAQTVKGTCTGNFLTGGARFTAATTTTDSSCASCAPGSLAFRDVLTLKMYIIKC